MAKKQCALSVAPTSLEASRFSDPPYPPYSDFGHAQTGLRAWLLTMGAFLPCTNWVACMGYGRGHRMQTRLRMRWLTCMLSTAYSPPLAYALARWDVPHGQPVSGWILAAAGFRAGALGRAERAVFCMLGSSGTLYIVLDPPLSSCACVLLRASRLCGGIPSVTVLTVLIPTRPTL